MGGGHAHHGPSAAARHRRPLVVALVLTGGFVVVELVAGVRSGSLALLSDAGHMLTDTLGLALSLAAVTAAGNAPHAGHAGHARESGRHAQRTFGLFRLEILAALANTLLLVVVAGYVVWQAISRIGTPVAVQSQTMTVVALGGLAVNVVVWVVLRRGAKESLNVRGAHLEVLADLVGSAAVLVGGLVIMRTGWNWVDPVVAIAIGAFIMPRAISLGGQALRILVEQAPRHVDVAEVRTALESIPDVVGSHDLHVWTLTSGMDTATVHLQVRHGADSHAVLDNARTVLQDRFHIGHATVQTEPVDHQGCQEVTW